MDENRLPELPQEAFRPMIAQSVQLEQFLGEELTFCFRDLDGAHTLSLIHISARKLFQKDKRTKYEALVMRLAGQALLSTAEIIKCIDKNISRLPNE